MSSNSILTAIFVAVVVLVVGIIIVLSVFQEPDMKRLENQPISPIKTVTSPSR